MIRAFSSPQACYSSKKKEDKIDNAVGVEILKKCGEEVTLGEILGYIHANDKEKAKTAVRDMEEAYSID